MKSKYIALLGIIVGLSSYLIVFTGKETNSEEKNITLVDSVETRVQGEHPIKEMDKRIAIEHKQESPPVFSKQRADVLDNNSNDVNINVGEFIEVSPGLLNGGAENNEIINIGEFIDADVPINNTVNYSEDRVNIGTFVDVDKKNVVQSNYNNEEISIGEFIEVDNNIRQSNSEEINIGEFIPVDRGYSAPQ